MAETAETKVQTLHVYHGRLASFKYVFKDGREAIFQPNAMDPSQSIYRTADEKQVAELEAELAGNHLPYVYTKPGEETVQSDMIDPVEAFKRWVIEEYERKKEAELANPNNDRGNYAQGALIPTNSNNMGALAGAPGVPNLTPASQKILSIAGLAKKMS